MNTKQETFDRPYVEELRSENKTLRGKMIAEREQRVAVEKERDEAKAAAKAAKEAADQEATVKVTAAEQRYRLRLLERFVVYDPEHGLHVFRDFAKNQIVSDPNEIAFLEFRDAPIERIPLNPKH